MIEHQLRELAAIDQDHSRDDMNCELDRFRREARGGDEYALRSALSMERSDEALNFWAADRPSRCPALGLDVDLVEAELVFSDDAVDAFISALTQPLGGIRPTSAVTHRAKDI